MKTGVFVFFLVSFLAALVRAGAVDPLVLTGDSFDEVVSHDKWVAVKAFAPWCGHCKNMAPAWRELAWMFEGSEDVLVAELDCADGDNKEKCQELEVRGYPTVLLFPPGEDRTKTLRYEDQRDLESMARWIISRTESKPTHKLPASPVTKLTAKTFGEVVGHHKSVLLSFTASWCGHCKRMKPEWEKLAVALADVADRLVVADIDAAVEKEIAGIYQIRGFPTIKLIPPEGGAALAIPYEGARSAAAMETWVRSQLVEMSSDLAEDDGRLPEIDALVAGLTKGDKERLEAIRIAAAPFEELGKIYVFFAEQIVGGTFDPVREMGLMDKIIESDNGDEADRVTARVSKKIIAAFLAKPEDE